MYNVTCIFSQINVYVIFITTQKNIAEKYLEHKYNFMICLNNNARKCYNPYQILKYFQSKYS